MVADLVKNHNGADERYKKVFGEEREIIGRCPKCGSNIYEGKVNFYCADKECKFSLFKDNKYFASMRKKITKSIAVELLDKGKAKVGGLYPHKKNTTFTARIVLDAGGKYPKFSMEFPR